MFDEFTNPHRKKSVLVYVVFGLIALAFVFIDVGSGSRSGNDASYAATVNGTIISFRDFQTSMTQVERRYANFFGGNFSPNEQQRKQLADEAINTLIQQEVILQAAKKAGIDVSKKELNTIIQMQPYFQENGVFLRSRYEQVLDAQRMTPSQFEKDFRRDVLIRKVQGAFSKAIVPSSFQAEREKAILTRKVDVEYIAVDKNLLAAGQKVSDADVAAYVADASHETVMKDYFETNKKAFQQEEKVHARHILIKISDKVTDDQALAKVKEIEKELKTKPFAELAKTYSQDVGSKDKGGDLGFFAKGAMVPEFETIAFSLKKGEVSKPVKTAFGYHLIEVVDKKDAVIASYDDAKKEIARRLIADQKAVQAVESLQKVVENPAQVDAFAKNMNLKWVDTGFFDMGGESLGALNRVKDFVPAAFSLSAKNPLYNKVLASGDKYYVIRFKKEEKVEPKNSDINYEKQLQARAINDVFSQWMQGAAKVAKIKRNDAMLMR